MARKRGGLAGVWDRNKGIIKTAVPAALSFIPGVGVPLAAAAGAAMEGFDQPGKSGIKFDIGKGWVGAAKGYGAAKTTQGIAGGLKGMFAPRVSSTKELMSPLDMKSQITLTPAAEAASGRFSVAPVDPASVARLKTATGLPMQPARSAAASASRIRAASAPVTGGAFPTSAAPASVNVPGLGMRAANPFGGMTSNQTSAFGFGTPSLAGAAPSTSVAPQATAARVAPRAMAARPAPSLAPINMTPSITMSQEAAGLPAITGPSSSSVRNMLSAVGSSGGGGTTAGSPMSWTQAFKQPQVLSGIAQGVLGQLPSAQSAALNRKTDIAERQQKMQEEDRQRELDRRRMVMQMLMPYFQQNIPGFNASAYGG